MPRISQGPAVKGSQKWIQRLVNEKPDFLNSRIKTKLNLPNTDTITWFSPLAEDGYAEYQDQARQKHGGQAFPDQLFTSSTITPKK